MVVLVLKFKEIQSYKSQIMTTHKREKSVILFSISNKYFNCPLSIY